VWFWSFFRNSGKFGYATVEFRHDFDMVSIDSLAISGGYPVTIYQRELINHSNLGVPYFEATPQGLKVSNDLFASETNNDFIPVEAWFFTIPNPFLGVP